jgi:hypothetical protein
MSQFLIEALSLAQMRELAMRWANQPVKRMAAGARISQIRLRWAAAIAHFFRSAVAGPCVTNHTPMKTIACKLLSAALLLCPLCSHAEVVFYFGVDISPWPLGPNNEPRPASTPNSTQAASNFLARLVSVQTESFETFAYDSVPTNLTFGTNLAVLSSPSNNPIRIDTVMGRDMGTDGGGEYPASGTNWLEVVADGTSNAWFTVTFNTPKYAKRRPG